jgi:starvation-inducible DNA-binding protein
MSNSIALSHTTQPSNHVTLALQDVLSSTYGLFLSTHNYHWNVEGGNFIPLHKLFEEQYSELFQAIDEIAERIRALGDYALPFEGKEIFDISNRTSNALNKEDNADDRASRMVHNLIMMNKAVIAKCQTSKKASQEANDDETENLMVTRVTVHQKALWMLNSILK